MEPLADFIARHAVAVLMVAVIVTLALAALFWRLVNEHGPRAWALTVRMSSLIRQSALVTRLQRTPMLGPLLAGAMTTARYLGLFAVLALLVAAGASIAFFELADEIGVDESLGAFDVALSAALREHLSAETLRAFALITHLGDVDVLIGVVVAAALALALLRRWMLAAVWLFATSIGALLNMALKAIFARERPPHDHGFTFEEGFSFPSGHASGSLLVYGLLSYMIVRHAPPAWRIPVALIGAALVIFVGSSRVLLQVHYISDVLAGYASAAAWVGLCIAGLEIVRQRDDRL